MFTDPQMHPASEPGLGLPGGSVATHTLLDLMGPVAGQHVLVIGPGALGVMCALNARGAVPVMSLQPRCRARAEAVDIIVAPNVFCTDTAEIAILRARAASRQQGCVYLRFAPGEGLALIRDVRECLLRHGFNAGRTHWLEDRAVIVADRAVPGMLPSRSR